jgi:hypothetical protein
MYRLLAIGCCLAALCACTDVPEKDLHAPYLVSMLSMPMTITQGEDINFTAVLTDEDGQYQVKGGSLYDGEGNYYGEFHLSWGAGVFELDTTWEEINAVEPIVGADRWFEGWFWDYDGLESEGYPGTTVYFD